MAAPSGAGSASTGHARAGRAASHHRVVQAGTANAYRWYKRCTAPTPSSNDAAWRDPAPLLNTWHRKECQHIGDRNVAAAAAQKPAAAKSTIDLLEGRLRRRSAQSPAWSLDSVLQGGQRLCETATWAWSLGKQASTSSPTQSSCSGSTKSKGASRIGRASAAGAAPAAPAGAQRRRAADVSILADLLDETRRQVQALGGALAGALGQPAEQQQLGARTGSPSSQQPLSLFGRELGPLPLFDRPRGRTGTVVMRPGRPGRLTALGAPTDVEPLPQPSKPQRKQPGPHHQQQEQFAKAQQQGDGPAAAAAPGRWFRLWALFVLAVSYVHQSTTASSVPAMLPMIGPDLGLSDLQGALLTSGYSYLYALALVPVGLLADRLDRPKLLAGGLALWSGLTVVAAHVGSFGELMAARVGFAAAQATQNPISFSLIPDLFPASKSTAMAVYNCAIYLGRALSFGAVIQARSLAGAAAGASSAAGDVAAEAAEAAAVAAGGIMVPLDKLDLSRVSILYTTGDSAVIAPVYSYSMELQMMGAAAADAAAGGGVDTGAWRDVLTMIAAPGFVISALLLATVADPKQRQQQQQQQQQQQPAASSAAEGAIGGGLLSLLASPAFMTVTLAAALNDVGSYAFLAWQSTFYERVYHLEPASYAPVLAAVLPIGGIIGGVGGGLMADALSKIGQRYWLTVGASMLSAPLLAESVLAADARQSFAALLLGFGLAEAWRAPSAVLIRSIAPQRMGSTASALYLCVRNLVGGLGPLAVAKLADVVGLQQAMLLAPACYGASGVLFLAAELIVKAGEQQQQQQQS